MSNGSPKIDKDTTFFLAKQLSAEDKVKLLDLLKEETSGVIRATSDKEEYLKLVREASDYGQVEFDKNILYISSSALGLTIAFIDKIVKLDEALGTWFLWIGWVLLGSTILLYVLSHLISAIIQINLIKKVKSLDATGYPQVSEHPEINSKIVFGTRLILGTNLVLYLGMASGIFFIMKFLFHNL